MRPSPEHGMMGTDTCMGDFQAKSQGLASARCPQGQTVHFVTFAFYVGLNRGEPLSWEPFSLGDIKRHFHA